MQRDHGHENGEKVQWVARMKIRVTLHARRLPKGATVPHQNKCEVAPASFFCGTDMSSFAMCQSHMNSAPNKSQHKKLCGIHGESV
jgi:hypothetical protein